MKPQPKPYRDPITALSHNRFGVGEVDLLHGEDRTVGKTYHFEGWFRMNDMRKAATLRQLAEGYGGDPEMRWYVSKMLSAAGCQPRDFAAQAAAIHSFAQNACYYTNEPGEQIQSPWVTIRERTGDCDDLALLMATMAESVSLPWKFALAGKLPSGRMVRWVEGQRWPTGADMFHIYVYLGWPPFEPKTWCAAEPTIRGIPLGYDVVDRGLPGHAAQSVDLGGGQGHKVGSLGPMGRMAGYGDPNVAALVSPNALFNNVQGNVQPTQLGPVQNPVDVGIPVPPQRSFFYETLKTAYSYIDWKDLVNALTQGIIIAIAVPYAVNAISKRKHK